MRKTKVLELLSRNLNVSFFDASFSVLLVLCSAESTEAEGEEEDVETKDASLDRKAAAAELSRPRLENVGQDEDFVDEEWEEVDDDEEEDEEEEEEEDWEEDDDDDWDDDEDEEEDWEDEAE